MLPEQHFVLEQRLTSYIAVVKKNCHRNVSFSVNDVPLDSTDYCKAYYVNGMRIYRLRDKRWGAQAELALQVVALPDREGAVWLFDDHHFPSPPLFRAEVCAIANPKLHRNGDIGADKPGVFEAAADKSDLKTAVWKGGQGTFFVIDSVNKIANVSDVEAQSLFMKTVVYNSQLSERIKSILCVEQCEGQMINDVRLATEGQATVFHSGRSGGMVSSPMEVVEDFKSMAREKMSNNWPKGYWMK